MLRAQLQDNPNDIEAFRALADLVRRRAIEAPHADPLTAEAEPADRQAGADVAVWALAEELAGNPRGWYPLIELARLSLVDDHEGAMRRLGAAVERETSGRALADGILVLREAGMAQDGLGFGVGHWDPASQIPEAGRQVVLAALDAQRPADARRHLAELAAAAGDDAETGAVVDELTALVARAETSA
ncbi:conserved hypothetical protein [Beutenbergia cavernae DSM 12333]|uniref:Uncharacterized protein n=1 Tax=Beutenbergia cavernae (strain ATCC BAA-8 / DSM 12333 / CCUG 43141 / JCM 11478 / NBRC 16432 / NCIMB 13614 / HKI 0122) TaxID=471853 RepID=C5C4T7_BEUC1|nr:conserved hypothetical protein [Beutenbergia cavernae DSM 12333]